MYCEIRTPRAAELILSGMAIKDIATELGFDDYFYFLMFFKTHYGTTPTELRKKYFLPDDCMSWFSI